MEDEIECQDCGWKGIAEELVSHGDDSGDYHYCPHCKSDNLENLNEDAWT